MILCAAVFLAACAVDAELPAKVPPTVERITTASTEAAPILSSSTTETNTTTSEQVEEKLAESIAGLTSGETPVYADIGSPEPFRILPSETILGTPTVVSIIDEFPGWVQALLPGRPNGEAGWIRAHDVEIFTLDREVIVDLDARQLTVVSNDEVMFTTAIAIGSEVSPTPTGTFFVTDAVQLTAPGGPWGPYAFGLSARSDVVTEFNGGDGIVGIHGTNQPASIGNAASLGCVRLPNDVITLLWDIIAVGMKVTILQSA